MADEMAAVFVGSSLRLGMPLVLAATGELVSERAGVLNMSVEGMMLMGAFGGAIGAWATGSPMPRPRAIGILAADAGGAAAGLAERHAARQPDRHRHRHQHPDPRRHHHGLPRDPRPPFAHRDPGPGQVGAAGPGRHRGLRRRGVPPDLAAVCGAGADRLGRPGCCATPRSVWRCAPSAPSRGRSTSRACRSPRCAMAR